MMNRSAQMLALVFFLTGCGTEPGGELENALGAAEADASTTISAKTGSFKVTFDRDITPVEQDGQTLWVLHGRTNTNITRAFSFICDDALGGGSLTGSQHFEVTFEWRDFEVALAPRTMYLAFTTEAGANYYATYTLAPRLTQFSGSNKIWADANLSPRSVDGITHYVGTFSTSKAAVAAHAFNDIDTDPTTTMLDSKHWEFDYSSVTQLLSQPMGGAPLFFRADFADGSNALKQAQLVISVPTLSVSTQEPY